MVEPSVEVQPAAEGSAPQGLPETPETLFFGGVRQALAPTDAPEAPEPDEDEEPTEPEPLVPVVEDEAEEEPPAEGRAASVQPSAEELVQALVADPEKNVALLKRLPNADSAAALKAYGDSRAKQAATDALTVLAGQMRQVDAARQFVAQVDDHFKEDPDGKLAWLDSADERIQQQVAQYREAKAFTSRLDGQAPEAQLSMLQALNDRATREYNRLSRFPDLQQQVVERQQNGRYPATEDGVTRLQADIDDLLSTAATNGTAPTAKARPKVARPIVPANGVAPGAGTRPREETSNTDGGREAVLAGIEAGMRGARR